MSFKLIDEILYSWASKYSLRIYTNYQDSEVRSTDIIDSTGNKYQIWIEQLLGETEYSVNIWDYRKRRKTLKASNIDLELKLEMAYRLVNDWIENPL